MIRAIEYGLLAVGLVCLGWWGRETIESMQARRTVLLALERPASAPAAAPAADDRVVGRLEIPRLRLSTPVLVGVDDQTLRAAAGLLPDTPRPWQEGNAAIAGHRDGVFRPLRHIRVGDRIRMFTPRGNFEYEVRNTRLVSPDDLSVLKPGRVSSLTLITCYPFTFVGHAPDRFIVHADRVP